ncbi:hypothetical protein AVDCRST_MAG81-2655 [uncultured Synechococcales cyanobacterium]|uniref:Uncharacterized protein n=1 Tax=uncultured Synechococcales cyanobacterium TaxID=1936017 RepID=A0A6J4VLN4_9CYAN|nr:hypothetical protein AVDCRST_MAG81-2655 [uncultured Synechococcales cyanobacterium]
MTKMSSQGGVRRYTHTQTTLTDETHPLGMNGVQRTHATN